MPIRQAMPWLLILMMVVYALPSSAEPTEGDSRNEVTESPDGRRVVYYLDYDFYPAVQPPPPMEFRVADTATGQTIHEVTVPYLGKIKPEIRWIDSRYVLLRSRLAVILDARSGAVTETAYGYDFTSSPDARVIAYLHGYAPMYFAADDPPEDHVFLWARTRGGNWDHTLVYPEAPGTPPGRLQRPPLEERHIVVSNSLWSKDGNQLVFLAFQGGDYELGVITVSHAGEGISAEQVLVPFHHGEAFPGLEDVDRINRALTTIHWVDESENVLGVVYDSKTYDVPLTRAKSAP